MGNYKLDKEKLSRLVASYRSHNAMAKALHVSRPLIKVWLRADTIKSVTIQRIANGMGVDFETVRRMLCIDPHPTLALDNPDAIAVAFEDTPTEVLLRIPKTFVKVHTTLDGKRFINFRASNAQYRINGQVEIKNAS